MNYRDFIEGIEIIATANPAGLDGVCYLGAEYDALFFHPADYESLSDEQKERLKALGFNNYNPFDCEVDDSGEAIEGNGYESFFVSC